eukprot:SAG31_NODE_1508_length_8063_cov_3.156956_2_plen_174_part_00
MNTQTCITCETSRNHHYRAAINTFLRKYVAGLDMPTGVSSWSVVKIRPEAAAILTSGQSLTSASATINAHVGAVHVSWKRNGSESLALDITIPPGSSGEVHVPKLFGDATVVKEGGRTVWSNGDQGMANGSIFSVRQMRNDDDRFVKFATSCGVFSFVSFRAAATPAKQVQIT